MGHTDQAAMSGRWVEALDAELIVVCVRSSEGLKIRATFTFGYCILVSDKLFYSVSYMTTVF